MGTLHGSFVTAAMLVAMAGISASATAADVASNSRGVSIVTATNMLQADGSTSQTWTVKFVQENLEGPYNGESWGGECNGMGLVASDGAYSGVSRCSISITADDGYTFELKDSVEGGDWVITGGKGKFKGVAGKGRTTYTWGDPVYGDKIGWTSEGVLNLP